MDAADRFCRSCGAAVSSQNVADGALIATGESSAIQQNHAQSLSVEVGINEQVATLLNNRLLIFGLIAMTGPLGLPALWFSPKFKTRTKIIGTVLFLLLTTALPIALAWYWLDYSIQPLVEAFKNNGQ